MSQNSTHPGSQDLAASLAVESAAWQAMLNVLGEEERALVDGEADLLPKLNASKLTQLQTLSNLSRARQADLVAAGLTPDHAGMESWLARQNQTALQTCWNRLCDMEQQAQAMNQRIGALIELRLNATRQALNVLVHAATSKGGLYGQDGCSVASRNGKPLTAA